MIFGNIKDLDQYGFLDKAVRECFAYAAAHDLLDYEKGRHEIDGDRLFVNIVEYETTAAKNRFWEAHRQYLDLHLMLKGPEQIDLNFISNMEQKTFEEDKDFLPLEGRKNSHVILEQGDFLLCLPQDGHRTAVAANGMTAAIKKAIFKIKITN